VSERETMERNEANARLQAVLAFEPGFQACVTRDREHDGGSVPARPTRDDPDTNLKVRT
jgi:hypothetical protein